MVADEVLGFTLPDRHARGRLGRLGPVLDQVLAAHDYPAPIRDLLAEALVLTGLMGSLLKDEEGQLTLQAQCEGGAVDLLVCDYRRCHSGEGELRGYVRHDDERLAALPDDAALGELCGGGYLAITFDLAASGERYQGIVPLEGDSLAEACERYFAHSEQIPTLIRIGLKPRPGGMVAGGLLIQHLAEGEEGRERLHVRRDQPEWEHVALLAQTIRSDELTDGALPLDTLLWRLFHEEREVRAGKARTLTRGCRCTVRHFEEVLRQFPEDELAGMRNEAGVIPVDCAFCSRLFPIEL